MIGIYKITSPSGKVYIGQSIQLDMRIKTYKSLECKSQPRLYNSLVKYGPDKHNFEIIEECEVSELNDKERYYQDIFECIGKNGLNCKLTTSKDKSGFISEETKDKISKSNLGKKMSIESIVKSKLGLKRRYENGYINPRLGSNHTEEAKTKLSISKTGKKLSDFHKEKIRLSLLGSKRLAGRKLSDSHKLNCKINATKYKSKIVLDLSNGVYYDSAKDLSDISKIPHSTLRSKLNGCSNNNTNYIYA